MKAIVYTKYGSPDVLQLKDVEKPTPKDDDVLIKVYAASVNAYDWHFLTADIFLIRLMGAKRLAYLDRKAWCSPFRCACKTLGAIWTPISPLLR